MYVVFGIIYTTYARKMSHTVIVQRARARAQIVNQVNRALFFTSKRVTARAISLQLYGNMSPK